MRWCYLGDTSLSHMFLTVSSTPGVEAGGEEGRAWRGKNE